MNWDTFKKNGFIVAGACYVFNVLRQVSLFQQVRNISHWLWMLRHKNELKGKSEDEQRQLFAANRPITHTYVFPELWVIGNIVCGMAVYALMAVNHMPRAIGWIFVILAILRAFEIMVYHVNVLLFDPLIASNNNQQYAIKSATRMLLLLLCNMLEYVICFSLVYVFFQPDIMSANFWQPLSLSISAFLNINIENMEVHSSALIKVIHIESILGIFMNLICIARFINMLPSVNTIDKN